MISYEQLFRDRFRKSTIIDETFAKIYNNESLKKAIEYLKSIGATKLFIDNYAIKYRINKWTQKDLSDEEKIEFLNQLLDYDNYILSVKIENNPELKLPEVIVETKKGVISAIKFSDFFPEIKKETPYIESEERYGKCFTFAYHICKNLSIENNLTTGYVYGYSDKSPFLHSWVETIINGEEYVIDGTLNAIINKEGYYRMMHAKPITKINKKTLEDDLKKYPIIDNENIELVVYYVFRNEIIQNLEKNNEIFKNKTT